MSYCLKLLFVLLLFVKREVDLAILVRKFVYQKDMSEYCRRRVMPSVFLGRQVVDAHSQILHFSRLELPYSCFRVDYVINSDYLAATTLRGVQVSQRKPQIQHHALHTATHQAQNNQYNMTSLCMSLRYDERTESGSNIILVINLMSDKSLIEACNESSNQLLVYEIGETFGGYWGALPDSMMKSKPHTKENHVYTLETTEPTTTTTRTKRTTTRRTTPSTTEDLEAHSRKSAERVDEVAVEIPLVNASFVLFDVDEPFDTKIDTKPGPGVSYKTKILPLVQFEISDEVSGRRTSEADEAVAPRYEVDLNADLFTPDARLSYPILRQSTRSKQRGKYKYNYDSRLDFKKNKKLLAEKDALFHRSQSSHEKAKFDTHLRDVFPRPGLTEPSRKETEHMSNPFEIVDAILKNLSKTKDAVPKTNVKIDKDVENLLQGLAKIGHNESGFLVPNSSWYTRRRPSTARRIFNKYRTDSITWRQPSANYRTNYFEEEEDTSTIEGASQDANKSFNLTQTMNNNDSVIIDVERSGSLLPPALDVDRVLLKITQQSNEMEKSTIIVNPETLALQVSGTTTTATTPEILKPMTLVDHESWENMVQAASLMAVVLNQSITSSVDGKQQGLNVTLLPPGVPGTSDVRRRKKRYIHAIPIEFAKPHHLPVEIEVPSSTVYTDKISDAQEFVRLVEMQDDEVHDRVALRYLRQYVGSALFNICDFQEAASKHVFLFNSSRLVLAISNFTLERMTVVMTPARALLTSEARCAAAHLECQVSGARVCIDSLCACDGVPNCGQYDIYDEDRLSCGVSAGLQHNVCLAAITFLAVLLTILYTVHYWLKRCVPKVSDAFFIYTDAAENVLYLDTIMRSPHDTDEPKDTLRNAALQVYMECSDMGLKKKKTVGTFIGRFCQILRCKRKKKQSEILGDQIIDGEDDDMVTAGNRRFYSFAEAELAKMGARFMVDAAVQTGSSFEINLINEPLRKDQITKEDSFSENIVAHYEGRSRSLDRKSIIDLRKDTSDELSILNFFRRARSISMQMGELGAVNCAETQANYTIPPNTEEKEIQSLEYDCGKILQVTESITETTAETSDKKPESLVKKLRFEKEMTTIHVQSDDDVVEEDSDGNAPDQLHGRRSVSYGGSKNSNLDGKDSKSNINEPSTSTGNREFKSYFWGSGKNKPKKPTKKKTQQLNIR